MSHPYEALTERYFAEMVDAPYIIDYRSVHENILKISDCDKNGSSGEKQTRRHYMHYADLSDALLWVNRQGVSSQADSLVACLDSCSKEGFSPERFRLKRIHSDMDILRNYAFTEQSADDEKIDIVIARLEYNLTRAFFTYVIGQRYGFVNPKPLLNALDVRDSDSVRVTYRQLFDIPIHIVGPMTYSDAVDKIRHDSAAWYIKQAMDHSSLYQQLKACLDHPNIYDRKKVLINMERARWYTVISPQKEKDHIIVNIPSFHLWAMRDDQLILDSKIGCGSKKTKTPLLYSKVKRMDINPQWIIPMSIRKKDIAGHAGDGSYFNSRRYFARNKKTGQKLTGSSITWSIITSPDWSLVQEGGAGNSLGRIIFRFDNNFSVYMHDTSSRGVFSRDNRDVSHGCIRVEKPYELALYLLNQPDEETSNKIKYSMEADLAAQDCNRSMILHSLPVEPQVPLFITYYTLFPVPNGTIQAFSDVYGYDEVLLQTLRI